MKKLIEFKDLDEAVQDYANKHCEGNFNLAVRVLIRRALELFKEPDLRSKEND